MSGNITASLYPLGPPSSMSHVDVRCMSGSTSLVLHPYVKSPQASLRTLSTDFRGGSGGLKIRFPPTWEGEVISHLNVGSVRHEWEGLRVLRDGPRFTATKGSGLGQLNIWGSSMDVELVGERMLVLPMEAEVHEEGARMPSLPSEFDVQEGERVSGSSSSEAEVQEEGERNPDSPKAEEGQEEGERVAGLPKEEQWQEEGDDDDNDDEDDWTVVARQPMPNYEELRTR